MNKSLLCFIVPRTFKKKKLAQAFFSLLLLFSFSPPASTETFTEITSLNFGTIAIKDNTATYTLRVRYTGQVINDPEIIIITPSTPAEYLISALPASTALTISITSPSGVTTSPAVSLSNEQFSISNFDYLSSVSSDANGDYTLFFGATISTSGSGMYLDTLYVTDVNINISF